MEFINSDELGDELARGELSPAYLLLGPEEYLRRRALSLVREHILSPEELKFSYEEHEAHRTSPEALLESLRTLPMIGGRRVLALTGVEQCGAALQNALVEYLQRPSSKSTLIMTADDMDRRTSFFKEVRARSRVVECPRLKGYALSRWVEEYVRRRGYLISRSVADRLAALAGPGLLGLISEIDKVLAYAGAEKAVSAEMVDQLVPGSRRHSIFELTDAVGRRDRKAALRILNGMVDGGEPVLVILSMTARHLRQLLIAKEMMGCGHSPRDIAQAAQIPLFALEDLLRQARGMDQQALERTFTRLAEIDQKIKSSSAGDRLLLESLVHAMPD